MTRHRRPLLLPFLFPLAVLVASCQAGESSVLDKEAQLARFDWWDNHDRQWFAERIPFLETPDDEIDSTYYYRWEVLTKHLVYGSPEHGYTFTEFIDRPFWSGAYGSISCPLGHQFYEVRWLKDRRIVDDFARYWFEVPGAEPRSYSNWYGDAMWATYRVLGDRSFIAAVLPHMESQHAGWMAERWDPEHGMFLWDGMHDGMETNIGSRQTPQWFDGAEGYRPTLNSYLYADMVALSKAHALLGNDERSQAFAASAQQLKQRVQEELWDPGRGFFLAQFGHDEVAVSDPWPGAGNRQMGNAAVAGARIQADGSAPAIAGGSRIYETGPWAGDPHGREAIGFVPWQFGLPDPGYEQAWATLMDPDVFFAEYGPTTTERQDPLFYIAPNCCVWSGNSWPYATSQTLTAMANLLNDYEQDVVSASDYYRMLRIYATTQRQDGRPYVAEAAHPDTGEWSGHNSWYHSEHYLHSAYVDLVITGLIGLRPRDDDMLEVNPLAPRGWDWFALDDVSYRGHHVSILWDRDGRRYGRGAGLTVWVDGELLASSPELGRLQAALPVAPAPPPPPRPRNFAVNNERAWFPAASASSSRPEASPGWAVDGNIWYHRTPANRWVPEGGNGSDWFEVDFGIARPVHTVKLYFPDDRVGVRDVVGERMPGSVAAALATAPLVTPPWSYRLLMLSGGEWVDVPTQRLYPERPAGRQANFVTFPEIVTEGLRVVLSHPAGGISGLVELEAWGDAELPLPVPEREPANFAFGDSEGGATVTASHAAPGLPTALLNDGEIAYNLYTDRAWRATGSPNTADWIEVDLGTEHEIHAVDLFLWAWEGRGTAAPRSYEVEFWDGAAWAAVENVHRLPATPTALALNTATFDPVRTRRVRVVLHHALPEVSALSEIRVR